MSTELACVVSFVLGAAVLNAFLLLALRGWRCAIAAGREAVRAERERCAKVVEACAGEERLCAGACDGRDAEQGAHRYAALALKGAAERIRGEG